MAVNVAFTTQFLDLSSATTAASSIDAAVTEGDLLAQFIVQGLTVTWVTLEVASSISAPPPPAPPPSSPPPSSPPPPLPHTTSHTNINMNRDAVVLDIIVGGMTSWSTREQAALKASLAESLGVNEGNVQIENEGLEVKADVTVSGLTAQDWEADPDAFAGAMQHELGFPVDVTEVNFAVVGGGRHRRRLQQTTGSLEALEVLFTVQGLKDIGSTLTTMAKIVEITSSTDTAAMSGSQSSSKSRLLGALTVTEGQIVQVSQAAAPVIEATEHVIIEVPTGMQASDLAQIVVGLVPEITVGMQYRGYIKADIRFAGAPITMYATAIPASPPPTPLDVHVAGASAGTNTKSTVTSAILGATVSIFILLAVFFRARKAHANRRKRQQNQELQGRKARYTPAILAEIEGRKNLVPRNPTLLSVPTSPVKSSMLVSTPHSTPPPSESGSKRPPTMPRPSHAAPAPTMLGLARQIRSPPARVVSGISGASFDSDITFTDSGGLMPISRFARSVQALKSVGGGSGASIGGGRGISMDGGGSPPVSHFRQAVEALRAIRHEDTFSGMTTPVILPPAPGISGSSRASPGGGGTSTSGGGSMHISQFTRSLQALKDLGAVGRARLNRTLSFEARARHTPPSTGTGSSSDGGIPNDSDASSAISQFRNSLAALKNLGVTGIRGEYAEVDSSIEGATREREVANIHTLIRNSSLFGRKSMTLNPRDDNIV